MSVSVAYDTAQGLVQVSSLGSASVSFSGAQLSADVRGSVSVAVDSVADVSAYDATNLSDGAVLYSKDVKDYWTLSRSSTLNSDGITVVLPSDGLGRWVRSCMGNSEWAQQNFWHVDSVNGSDTNDGFTSGSALKTGTELARRLNGQIVRLDSSRGLLSSSLFIHNDILMPDALFLDFTLGVTGSASSAEDKRGFVIQGVPKTVASGTLTSTTAIDRATNTPASINAGGMDLSPYIKGNYRLKFLSDNAVCYVVKSLGGGSYRISPPLAGWPGPAKTPRTAGEQFIVESLPVVERTAGSVSNAFIYARDLCFNLYELLIATPGEGAYASYPYCIFSGSSVQNINRARNVYTNPCFINGFSSAASTVNVQGGASFGPVSLSEMTSATVFDDFIVQGSSVLLDTNSYAELTCAAVFDTPGNAITIRKNSSARLRETPTYGVYGSGSTGYGIFLGKGTQIYQYSNNSFSTVKITGSLGDVNVGGTVKSWSDLGTAGYVNTGSLAAVLYDYP